MNSFVATLFTVGIFAAGPAPIVFTESVPLPAAKELDCYKIQTPTATFFLEKSGAGLASLLDKDGHDWLNFRPDPGSGAGGEFRGFPNAVHQQAGNYFHPKNKGTDPSTTKVAFAGQDRVTITTESASDQWACQYDFHPTHCTFTMTKMPAGYKYWVLYEGTPGGQYDDTDWWLTSASEKKSPLTTTHEGDISAPEWIAFGDPKLNRALVLYHHEDDSHPDRFYQMQNKMTVFGFGRQGANKFLSSVPQRFSIGLVESAAPAAIRRHVETTWLSAKKE